MTPCDRAVYGPLDVARVRAAMERHVGPENAAPIGRIASEAGLPERKVRAILSDYDGESFLQGECGVGRYLARAPGEAEAMTARLRARALDELARVQRREAFAAAMRARPVEQLGLGFAT
jgi:hypothetical protein